MLKFAFKNMAIKKVQIILIVLSIVISAGIGVLAFNVATQVDEGITSGAQYYSAIVGPAGSNTQLAMNTMYFTDSPVGTIPYSVVSSLQQDQRVDSVIPFAMADNYNGYNVVGTTPAYLKNKSVAKGEMFTATETMQAVVGSNIAKYCDLEVGDVIYTSHSASSTDTHTQGLTVVGILEESHSSFDNVVFTQIKTLWDMHDHGEEHGEHEEGEEHQHTHGTVCAILVNTKNPGYAMQLVGEYDGKIITTEDGDNYTLQAIEPMSIVRDVLNDADDTKYIVFVLCAVILIMNIMIISIITLLNMYHSAKEISLMRLIGISMKKINLLYIIQNSIMGLVSVLLAFGISRICMLLMNGYVESMGVVLNMSKVYTMEFIILLAVFIISVLPTAIWTFCMSRKDSIAD
ncbi:MAG: ABC transporter permease [Clostridia bacterium]|nr:ABC transporter permease [Clostridia bacterium]MBR4032378.1 ABC transporter permease [Clostridia bacterium]